MQCDPNVEKLQPLSGYSGFVKQEGSPDETIRLGQTPYPFQPH